MRFENTPLAGAFVLEIEPLTDERGFFARTFCREEFAKHGLDPELVQCSISLSRERGTLRGLHFQAAPHEEARVVRCTRGRIYDVIVDLREGSDTRFRSYGTELSAENRRQLYVPEGFAHGFQTLEPDTEAARGYHHASPAFGIVWPLPPVNVSPRGQELESLPVPG